MNFTDRYWILLRLLYFIFREKANGITLTIAYYFCTMSLNKVDKTTKEDTVQIAIAIVGGLSLLSLVLLWFGAVEDNDSIMGLSIFLVPSLFIALFVLALAK